jgi:hypothetical protein
MLKAILRSPAEYRARYIDKTLIDKPSRSKLLGSVTHTLVLQPELFPEQYWVRPTGIDGRSKAGKAALAELAADNAGKVEIDAELLAQAQAMAVSVLLVPKVRELLAQATKRGAIERGIVWDEGGIACKARPDLWLPSDEGPDWIWDLKTSDDPTPDNWRRRWGPIERYGYHLQAAHYDAGVMALTSCPNRFGLIVVGSDPPHDCYLYDATAWKPEGRRLRDAALDALATATALDDWHHPMWNQVITLDPA